MTFYGGGEGVSTIGNPDNILREPVVMSALESLTNLAKRDYNDYKQELEKIKLHVGWGEFTKLTDKDCIIPVEQLEKLKMITLPAPEQASTKKETSDKLPRTPLVSQHTERETRTQSEFNVNVTSALELDDGLELTDILYEEVVVKSPAADDDEELVLQDAMLINLYTQLEEPTSQATQQQISRKRPTSPIFCSSTEESECIFLLTRPQ
jgi:hypothetical protein